MKNKIKTLATVLSILLLSSCGSNNSNVSESISTSSKTETSSSTISESTIVLKEFTGVSFDNATYSYDGNSHSLGNVKGAPEGTSIDYTNKGSYTDVGSYKAKAVLNKEGYISKTLEATLTITPIDFTGFTYDNVSITYDGNDHIGDVKLVGLQPDGTTVKETVKNSNGDVVTTATDVGTYSYSIEITNKNYNKLKLEATLTIKTEKTDMPVFASSDGTIYFANGLDDSHLYSLKEGTITRIDYSSPKEFNKYSSNSVVFISGTSLLNSVKEVKNGETNAIYTDSNIDDFVKYSDTVYYYSSNSLKASKSGIYKVDATNSNDEPIVTKVFEGKTDNLAINNGYLYFTNGNDKNYIYKMNLSSLSTSLVLNEKVHEFVINNNKLYCSVNGLTNDYIGYLNLSTNSQVTKLTNASGEFLTIKNNKLYFNYTDLFGKIDDSKYGIWSIDLSNNSETHVLTTSNVNGFDVESDTSLVYIDTNDLHLYRYNMSTKAKTDLLNGFVAPETVPFNTGGRTIAYGNKIYYLNMYAGKTLYVYDETSKKNYQLTTNKVADFYIYDDKLYFNQVTMLTNNDLYCFNLKVNSEAEKICSNDVRNMVSDGTYIYGTHYNFAGSAGGISRMKLDGSEYVKFSEVNGAKNLSIKDGKLYFINCASGQDNGNIEYIELSSISSTSSALKSTNLSKSIKNVKQFVFDGSNIFYIYNGTIDNSVRRTSFGTLDEGTKIASSKTNPNEIIVNGDYVYYYSYAVSALSYAGFYKVSKNATADGTQELLLGYDSTYYGSDFAISSSGNLYFLNYIAKLVLGNAHTYQLNLSTKVVTKID